MRFTLVFPESELRDVVAADGAVHLRFAAASVRDADGRAGWLPGVQLSLAGAALAGDARLAFGKIADGRLRRDGRPVPALALPTTLAADIDLALRLANGETLVLRGKSLLATIADDAPFTEDLSC